MPFTPTPAYVHQIFDPTAKGDWQPFLNALDPDVNWVLCDPAPNPKSLAGTYNVQTWLKNLKEPFMDWLTGLVHMVLDTVDVIGQKAIIESRGFATQKNGKPYNNRFCWILIFSEETGKVVVIREYMNSALTQEVLETNEAPK